MSSATPYGLKEQIGERRLHMHRAIAERVVGSRLPSRVQVHHVDGDKSNFANTNLVICEDAAYHQLLHTRTITVRAGGNPNTHRVCSRCTQAKPFDDFYARQDKPIGLTAWCKSCFAAHHQARRGPRKISPLYKLVSPEVQSRVFALLADGLSQRQVAKLIGVRQCSVSAFVLRMASRGLA